MARTKASVRGSLLPSDPSSTLCGAEGQQVPATALRPSTGSVKENNSQVLVGNSTASVVQDHIRPPRPQLQADPFITGRNFSPALGEKRSLETPISATIFNTFPGAGGQLITATAVRPSTGSVKENDNRFSVGNLTASVFQDLSHPPRPQRKEVRVKTEQDFSPVLGEKLPPDTPIPAPISSTFPGAKDLQAPAPAVWPRTLASAKEELGHGLGGDIITIQIWIQQLERAQLEKGNQKLGPASATISTAGVAVKKPRARRGLQLSIHDLVSDGHLLLTEKADKLGVSASLLKDRRRKASLGRWPGRRVRADIKREEAQVWHA